MPFLTLLQGTAQRLPLCDNSINCIVTSPPYWGLRSYSELSPEAWRSGAFVATPGAVPITIPGPETWEGLEACRHEWGNEIPGSNRGGSGTPNGRNNRGETYARGTGRGAWCQRCHCWCGTLGSEPTVDLFIFHLVLVLRELYRVLHSTGTLWLNLGDSYSASGKSGGGNQGAAWDDHGQSHMGPRGGHWHSTEGLAPGNLLGIPWRVALAAQAEGWILRRDVVWQKSNPMPESINGWRHEQERCACTIARSSAPRQGSAQQNAHISHDHSMDIRNKLDGYGQPDPACSTCHGTGRRVQGDCQLCHGTGVVFPATLRDVPMDDATFRATCDQYSCEACAGTGKIDVGLTLRRGSWRHTASHEMVFMLVKQMGYFANSEAVREEGSPETGWNKQKRNGTYTWKYTEANSDPKGGGFRGEGGRAKPDLEQGGTRNPRDVIRPAPSTYAGQHYATFPPSLPEHFLRASCPERVCTACGEPWCVVVRTEGGSWEQRKSAGAPTRYSISHNAHGSVGQSTVSTHGMARTCLCPDETRWHPGVVLDPFAGTATVAFVARALGRASVMLEASPAYLTLARERLSLDALDAWQGKPVAPTVETYTNLPLFT